MKDNNKEIETYVVCTIGSTVYIPCIIDYATVHKSENGCGKVKYTVIPERYCNNHNIHTLNNYKIYDLDNEEFATPDSLVRLVSNDALLREIERRKKKISEDNKDE